VLLLVYIALYMHVVHKNVTISIFHKVITDILQMRWKTFILLCDTGKFIQDTILQILSEAAKFYGRYYQNISAYFTTVIPTLA